MKKTVSPSINKVLSHSLKGYRREWLKINTLVFRKEDN